MLIETQLIRSKSDLNEELQGLPVTKAVIRCNADRKALDQMAKLHQGVRKGMVILTTACLHPLCMD